MKTSILVVLYFLCSQVLSQIDETDKINHREFPEERRNHVSNPLEQIKPTIESANFQNNDPIRTIVESIHIYMMGIIIGLNI